jgi:SAM-dependent methyltransferase
MFVRCKLRFDPLFAELSRLLAGIGETPVLLDIGCGHGVPACWCLEMLPGARVIGIDPDPERVRVAARAVGARGRILEGAAPELAGVTGPVDVVLLLDMLHYLDDGQLAATLRQCRKLLIPGGVLLLRFVIRPEGKRSWYWYVEDLRVRSKGERAWYRSGESLRAMAIAAGFTELAVTASANRELFWLAGRVGSGPADGH